MRKIFAFVLLLVLGLPSALPLFAAGQDDAGVPVCCRRNGKHHCAMQMGEGDARVSASAGDVQAAHWMRAAGEACPYQCGLLRQTHAGGAAVAPALRWYAAVVAHPAVHAQTESQWRVAQERSRGKRGPPSGDDADVNWSATL